MGDVILTTPIVRALRQAYPRATIHFLTKPQFAEVLFHNPNIDKIVTLDARLSDTIERLKLEKYHYVVDLHKNMRSHLIKWLLCKPSSTFPKANGKKWLMTKLKRQMSVPHIVNRYALALKPLGIRLDDNGLEVYLSAQQKKWSQEAVDQWFIGRQRQLVGMVLGATHYTKRWPKERVLEFIDNQLDIPFILLGGPTETEVADWLIAHTKNSHVVNAAGKFSILESAALMQHCSLVVTNDTGLMHIAAAFQLPMVTLWGNTVPGFGMTPYKAAYEVAEVKDLPCRPCSRIGYKACPKGHFKCMQEIDSETVIELCKRVLV